MAGMWIAINHRVECEICFFLVFFSSSLSASYTLLRVFVVFAVFGSVEEKKKANLKPTTWRKASRRMSWPHMIPYYLRSTMEKLCAMRNVNWVARHFLAFLATLPSQLVEVLEHKKPLRRLKYECKVWIFVINATRLFCLRFELQGEVHGICIISMAQKIGIEKAINSANKFNQLA